MDGEGGMHREVPQQAEEPQPWLITQIFTLLMVTISSYGWYCLIAGIAVAILFRKYSPALQSWQRKREEEQEAALYHKNPDIVLAREAALEASRMRMQQEYERNSREAAEKQRIKDEQKRQEKIEVYEAQQRGEGGRTLRSRPETGAPKHTKTDKKKSTFRQDYNPLLGDGGSCGWRPERRGRAGG